MLSKAQIKRIQSLKIKKYRQDWRLFTVEGDKAVCELLASNWKTDHLYATGDWIALRSGLLQTTGIQAVEVAEKELRQISMLQTPSSVLAVVEIPDSFNIEENPSHIAIRPDRKYAKSTAAGIESPGWILALDSIRDPGNLGTIIRSADWFGIAQIFCSPDSVDVFNPKVIQASMGSVFHLPVTTAPLEELLTQSDVPVFGALLEGESIYEAEFPAQGILLIGNEARGLSHSLIKKLNTRITIPSFGRAESLNAAMATSVILSEVRRRFPK